MLAEIHMVDIRSGRTTLVWSYIPKKGDGRNAERNEYFCNYYGDTNVGVTLPVESHEIKGFLDDLFFLVEAKTKVDALDENFPPHQETFPEGRTHEQLHRLRERNHKVVQAVKARELSLRGRLLCQVCGFDLEAVYGRLGHGFIEAHHTIPVSELPSYGGETCVEDIALVCCNCHKMLHRRRAWLTMEELKNVLTLRR